VLRWVYEMSSSAAPGWTMGRVASVVPIAGLLVYWFLQPVAFPLKSLGVLLVGTSIVSPAAGLLAFAGLAPLSTAIAGLCGAPGMGGQLLELMALGAGAGAILHGSPPEGRTRIGAAALFMAVVALASVAAMIPAAAAPFARSLADGPLLRDLALRQTAESSPVWSPVFAALVIAECALLAWATERTVRRSSGLAARLVAMGLGGHAAAALMSLLALVGGALRTADGLHTLPHLLMGVRVNVQADLNAAASALLVAGVAGMGLMKTAGTNRVIIGLLLVFVAAGLWMTGSRIALVMGAVAVTAAVGWTALRRGRRRVVTAAVAVLVLGASAWMVIASTSSRSTPLPRSIELRMVMASAGLGMFKEAPVFGIGVTKFYAASTVYAGPYLLSVGWRPFENAHNNFIQVLAEQGLVGLGALLWMLAIVLSSARSAIVTDATLRGALLLGIAACLGTWLTGHPLLEPEFAFVFWFYGGLLAALTPAVSRGSHTAGRPLAPTAGRPLGPRWLPFVLVGAVLASVPLRAAALRNTLELEHYGIGLSLWQHDDSQRYRTSGRSFTLYLPAGQIAQIPVRRAPGAPDRLAVEIRHRGRLMDRVPVEGEAWQNIVVAVPEGRDLFDAVEFDVRSQDSQAEVSGVLLRVGKAVAR
jgi:hypothetical protein